MKLEYKDFGGEGLPILILHGLFASSRNWVQIGKFLSAYGHSYALDLRNHGDSPHHPSHTLEDLVGDLREWAEDHIGAKTLLVGHSLGGLTAMGYAIRFPENVASLAVLDIAPKVYPFRHERELEALQLDISAYSSRQQIDTAMSSIIPHKGVRQFLQMNAERTGSGFRWKIDPSILERSTASRDFSRFKGQFNGRALFLVGGSSPYVEPGDYPLIRSFFPHAEIRIIPGADHWLHHTATDRVEAALDEFLRPEA